MPFQAGEFSLEEIILTAERFWYLKGNLLKFGKNYMPERETISVKQI